MTAADVDRRVDELLGRMTVEEKVAQLGGAWMNNVVGDGGFSVDRARQVMADGIGQITRVSGASGLLPGEAAAFTNAVQRFLVEETRLGIPAIVHEESTGGFSARGATQFPQAIGLASTWDPALVEEAAVVMREQMVAVGARQALAPVLDIARDPRWGRLEETYGEDPWLAARVGVAYVRGLQGDLRTGDLRSGVAATGKHFLGYALSEGGRNHGPVQLGPRELREVVAAPFRAAIAEAGLATVMNAYNSVDGLPCGASAAVLDDLLRGELGFEGVVVADYFTTGLLISHHRVAANREQAAARALAAGLDVELPELAAYPKLVGLVRSGEVAEELVDRSVRRVLALKFALGLFDEPYVDEGAAAAVFDTPAQRALARRVASRSIVLLKNDGLLPLDRDAVGSIAVVGPAAVDVRLLLGDYHYPAHQEVQFAPDGGVGAAVPGGGGDFAPGPYYVEMRSVADAIGDLVGPSTAVRAVAGCDVSGDDASAIGEAVEAAAASDVAIVVVGGKSGLTLDATVGEFRDATDLGLPGRQQELVEAVVATGTPTVVVVVSGRAHALPWIAEHVPAVLCAWVPGEEGGPAIADVLFGAEPGGRLPVSLPHSAGQLPVHYNQRAGGGRSQMYGDYVDAPAAALFPFGHGGSYTTFAYRDLEVTGPLSTAAPFEVACVVENTGAVAGEEVVQLYLRDDVAPVARPIRQLAGFVRVALAPGESERVVLVVEPSQLGFYDEAMRFIVEPGTVTVMVGASSADLRLEKTVELTGDTREVPPKA